MSPTGRIVVLRHGETEWSKSGQHTGRSDIPLTDVGRRAAARLEPVLASHQFDLVLISPLQRAQETASSAGLSGTTDDQLLEWDYGGAEGRTTPEIRQDRNDPSWTVWTRPIPPGKTPGEQLPDLGARADGVIKRIAPVTDEGGTVALVAHGHFLRVLTARWLGLEPGAGRLFALDPGTVSVLGYEHEQHVIRSWNALELDG